MGEVSPVLSKKLEKSGKLLTYGLNFLFKMQFLSYSTSKYPKLLPAGPFFLVLYVKCLSECPNSKKTPLPTQIPGYTPMKKSIYKFFGRALKKIVNTLH